VISNNRTKLNKNVFSFVPNSSLLGWRVVSRVKMNVVRMPLTLLSTVQRCCRGESRTAATSALTFMTFS
jgi:hypothetical protein